MMIVIQIYLTVLMIVMEKVLCRPTGMMMMGMVLEMVSLKNSALPLYQMAGLLIIMMKMIIVSQIFTTVLAYVMVMPLIKLIGMTMMGMD